MLASQYAHFHFFANRCSTLKYHDVSLFCSCKPRMWVSARCNNASENGLAFHKRLWKFFCLGNLEVLFVYYQADAGFLLYAAQHICELLPAKLLHRIPSCLIIKKILYTNK